MEWFYKRNTKNIKNSIELTTEKLNKIVKLFNSQKARDLKHSFTKLNNYYVEHENEKFETSKIMCFFCFSCELVSKLCDEIVRTEQPSDLYYENFDVLESLWAYYYKANKTNINSKEYFAKVEKYFNSIIEYVSNYLDLEKKLNEKKKDLEKAIDEDKKINIQTIKHDIGRLVQTRDSKFKSYTIARENYFEQDNILEKDMIAGEVLYDEWKTICSENNADSNRIDEMFTGIVGSEETELIEKSSAKSEAVSCDNPNEQIMLQLDKIIDLVKMSNNENKQHFGELGTAIKSVDDKVVSLGNKFSEYYKEFKNIPFDDLTKIRSTLVEFVDKKANDDAITPDQQAILAAGTVMSESPVDEAEILEPKNKLKDYVEHMLTCEDFNTNPYFCLKACYANIRATIDAYCRYVKGIELNSEQHIFTYKRNGVFKIKNEDDEFVWSEQKNYSLSNRLLKFTYCFYDFGKPVPEKICEIWNSANIHDHHVINEINKKGIEACAEETRKAALFLNDELGIDLSTIDYKTGVQNLLANEDADRKKLQRMSDDDFKQAKLNKEFSSNSSKSSLIKYSSIRSENFREYLQQLENQEGGGQQ